MTKLKDLPVVRGRVRAVGQDPHRIKPPMGIPFSESHPALAVEWDLDRNFFKPSDLTAGSDRDVYWIHRKCGQRIQAPINMRVRAWDEGSKNQGCYYCSGKTREKSSKISTLPAWLVDEAVPDCRKVPAHLLPLKSIAFRLWRCPDKNCSHIYCSRVCDRIDPDSLEERQGCPICNRGNGGIDLRNHPEYLEMFVKSTRNRGFDPYRLPGKCKVLWRGQDCGHFFSARFAKLFEAGSCLTCIEKLKKAQYLVSDTRLTREFVCVPNFPDLTPANITRSSNKVAVWRGACGHTFHYAVYRRTENQQNCNICSGHRSEQDMFFSLYPRLLKFWDYESNDSIEPDFLVADERKKYWLLCRRAQHSYRAALSDLLEDQSTCQQCKTLPNCVALVKPELIGQWDQRLNEERTPWNTQAGSNDKVWWTCPVHISHVWEAQVKKRVYQSTGCPYCANRKVSVTNSLPTKHPELVKYFHLEKNADDQRAREACEIIATTKEAIWWLCTCGEPYQRLIKNMVEFGPGCAKCKKLKRSLTQVGAKRSSEKAD